MRARAILRMTATAGLLAGAAGFVSAGPAVRDAEAGPRVKQRTICSVPARPVYRHVHSVACRASCGPWYSAAPRVVVAGAPYYFHSGFDVYFGGLALGFEISNLPPAGYAYYDPTCGRTFWSLAEYNAYRRQHRFNNPPVLHAVVIEDRGHGRWDGDRGRGDWNDGRGRGRGRGHDDDDDDDDRGRRGRNGRRGR